MKSNRFYALFVVLVLAACQLLNTQPEPFKLSDESEILTPIYDYVDSQVLSIGISNNAEAFCGIPRPSDWEGFQLWLQNTTFEVTNLEEMYVTQFDQSSGMLGGYNSHVPYLSLDPEQVVEIHILDGKEKKIISFADCKDGIHYSTAYDSDK